MHLGKLELYREYKISITVTHGGPNISMMNIFFS